MDHLTINGGSYVKLLEGTSPVTGHNCSRANRTLDIAGAIIQVVLVLALFGCKPIDIVERFPPPTPPTPDLKANVTRAIDHASAELDASGSSDPVGKPIQYSWRQIDGPRAEFPDNSTSAVLSVQWPGACGAIEATFEVTVDNNETSASQAIHVSIPGMTNRLTVFAGVDQSVVAGDTVALPVAIDNPDQRNIAVAWNQLTGPTVQFVNLSSAPGVAFTAPEIDAVSDLEFSVTVTDTICLLPVSDTIVVHVHPRAKSVRAKWSNSSAPVNIDLNWLLPAGTYLDVDRSNFGLSGLEAAFLEPELIPDGLHWLTMNLYGSGETTDVAFDVNILDYRFLTAQRVQADTMRGIALDVRDGHAVVVFNGWLDASADGAGGLAGGYPLEAVGAWRNADLGVATELNVIRPDGSFFPVFRQNFATQGLERTAVDPGVEFVDGTYRLVHDLYGNGHTGDVAFDARLLDFAFSQRIRLLADDHKMIGVDVHQGVARSIFNGWLDAAHMVGDLTPDRPLQVVAGFEAVGDDTAVELNVQMPNGSWLPVNRSNYSNQDFESIGLNAGTAIPDGVYRFHFRLFGAGRAADVVYKAKLLNWNFERQARLLGDSDDLQISVRVTSGVAQELGNTW